MTLTNRYGRECPISFKIQENPTNVCVKTTRYILEKHAHMSTLVIVETDLPETSAKA